MNYPGDNLRWEEFFALLDRADAVLDDVGDNSGFLLRYWYGDSQSLADAGEPRIFQSWRVGEPVIFGLQ